MLKQSKVAWGLVIVLFSLGFVKLINAQEESFNPEEIAKKDFENTTAEEREKLFDEAIRKKKQQTSQESKKNKVERLEEQFQKDIEKVEKENPELDPDDDVVRLSEPPKRAKNMEKAEEKIGTMKDGELIQTTVGLEEKYPKVWDRLSSIQKDKLTRKASVRAGNRTQETRLALSTGIASVGNTIPGLDIGKVHKKGSLGREIHNFTSMALGTIFAGKSLLKKGVGGFVKDYATDPKNIGDWGIYGIKNINKISNLWGKSQANEPDTTAHVYPESSRKIVSPENAALIRSRGGTSTTSTSTGGFENVTLRLPFQFRVFDSQIEDGDIVTVSVKDATGTVLGPKSITLTNAGDQFSPEVKPGDVDLSVTAENQGDLPPNTGAVDIQSNVLDGSSDQNYNLDEGETGNLNVEALPQQ